MTEKDRKNRKTVDLSTFKQKQKLPCINYKQVNLFFTSKRLYWFFEKVESSKST